MEKKYPREESYIKLLFRRKACNVFTVTRCFIPPHAFYANLITQRITEILEGPKYTAISRGSRGVERIVFYFTPIKI